LQQFKEFWQSLDKSQKKRLYITSAIVAVSIIISLVYLTRPNRITLISDISQKEAGEMSSILQENSIWNSFQNDGTSIIINTKDNNKAQIALAQKGYPKDGMTFEDAIKMISISTTESDKEHIWKQQQTSDIAAKLKMLDNIEDATVSLALPEQTIFLTSDQNKQRPTAYVMIKPKENLTSEQVQGIVMIVSRSVENLDPKDITVVDNNSNILNRDNGDESMDRVNDQEELRLKKSAELQQKVYEYFSVGQYDNFDTIRVVASANLDFDKLKSQTKTLTIPQGTEGGAIVSSDVTKENLQNGSVNGQPGVDSNPGTGTVPSYPAGNGDNSSYDKSHTINNFAYNENMSESEKATGYLVPEKSTMAISLWYGKRVTDESKLTDDFLKQVSIAASTATGIPVENISVNRYKLAAPEVVKKPAIEVARDIMNSYGLFAIFLFLIIGLLITVLPRRKKTEVEETMPLEPLTTAGERFIVPEYPNENIPEISLEEKSEVKKQIDKFVKQKPEAVAQLLRNWLSDDWNN
jgi:flagellar M-ring protein FliF